MNLLIQLDDEPPSFWPGQTNLTSATDRILTDEWQKASEYLLPAFRDCDLQNIEPNLQLFIFSDEQIRTFNFRYRNKDSATDVLSFPGLGEDDGEWLPPFELGELMISSETLERQAREIGHSATDEFWRLYVHGLLHLLGYDHERSPSEEKYMFERESYHINLLGV